MGRMIIETRFPPCKGKRNRGARSPLNRCAVCGRAVRDRGARLCRDCLSDPRYCKDRGEVAHA